MPSTSKSQQRLMGQAYAYRKGTLKKKDINPKYFDKIKELSKSMMLKDLKDFAETKHKTKKETLPEKVSEHVVTSFKKYVSMQP